MSTQKKTGGEQAANENAEAKAAAVDGKELAKAMDTFDRQYKDEISTKVRAGLTREQAVQVIRSQIAEDTRQAGAKGKK